MKASRRGTPQTPSRGTVLLVESHSQVRDALAGLLVAEGFAVSSVGNSEEGAAAAQTMRPDVIVLDVGLEGHGGARPHALDPPGEHASIPVVVLSAYGLQCETRLDGFSCGQLLDQVDQAVAQRRARAAA